MSGPVVHDGKPMRTERLSSVTGKHWLAWRFGGYWGRRWIIRVFLRYMRTTPENLAAAPIVIQFPTGWTYRILDVQGNHELIG